MEENPFLRQEAKKSTKTWVIVLQFFAIFMTVIVIMYLAFVNFNEVDGPSMQPNFVTDQALFTSRLHQWFDGTGVGGALGFEYKRGDVIIFKHPDNPNQVVKRIIGLPGETIRIERGVYYINGQAFIEQFATTFDTKLDNEFLIDGGQGITLGADEFFVSGDNRLDSIDSRDWGPIKKEWLVGKVFFRLSKPIGFIGTGKYTLQ